MKEKEGIFIKSSSNNKVIKSSFTNKFIKEYQAAQLKFLEGFNKQFTNYACIVQKRVVVIM